MMGLDVILRFARFAFCFFIASFGFLGVTFLCFSFSHYNAALYAVQYLGITAALEYVRVYHLPT
jgi:hypothetical protein